MYEDTLTLASQNNCSVDVFSRLLYSTNNGNIHTLNVKKAMLYACEYNNIEVVKFLVTSGFQLN